MQPLLLPDFGDAAIGDATADSDPCRTAAFGDVALGDGTALGADAAFGELLYHDLWVFSQNLAPESRLEECQSQHHTFEPP